MKTLWVVILLASGIVFAQDTAGSSGEKAKSGDEITVQGCVSRANGDYILIKQNPAMTYQLQSTRKIRLKNFLGQRVEITGDTSPTLSSSSDSLNKIGSASSVSLSIHSIKTVAHECTQR